MVLDAAGKARRMEERGKTDTDARRVREKERGASTTQDTCIIVEYYLLVVQVLPSHFPNRPDVHRVVLHELDCWWPGGKAHWDLQLVEAQHEGRCEAGKISCIVAAPHLTHASLQFCGQTIAPLCTSTACDCGRRAGARPSQGLCSSLAQC